MQDDVLFISRIAFFQCLLSMRRSNLLFTG